MTNKVSLNFHFFLSRAISSKNYQRISFKNLGALNLSLRSQSCVLLLSNKFLLMGNCLNQFSIGDLLVRWILYYLSSEMVTKSYLFPRRCLAVSLTMPQTLKKQILFERLSWNSCMAILSRKSFLRRTLSIPALAFSVQVNGEKRLILDLRLIDLHVHKQNLRVRNCIPLRTFLPKSFCFVLWFKVRLPSHRHFSRSSQIFGFLLGVCSRPYEIFPVYCFAFWAFQCSLYFHQVA